MVYKKQELMKLTGIDSDESCKYAYEFNNKPTELLSTRT